MEGDPACQQAEASDDGASSSQYELVEEEGGADGLEEAHVSTLSARQQR